MEKKRLIKEILRLLRDAEPELLELVYYILLPNERTSYDE